MLLITKIISNININDIQYNIHIIKAIYIYEKLNIHI